MPIMRKQKVNRYTTIDNYLIDDKRLDPEGKGYLIYMLRKPDNWNFNYKSIQNDLNVGERNVRTNINKLKDLKYLKIDKIKNEKGLYEYIYTVYEIPFDIDLKKGYYPDVRYEGMDNEGFHTDTNIINTNINKDKEDKQKYTSSFFNPEEHNRLTLELINIGYVDKEDLQLFQYDDFFEELLKENSYRNLIRIFNYVTSRVMERDFIDEEGYEIKNKLGYLKSSIVSNINKINNIPDDLYSDDFDWLNEDKEDDFEL